MNAFNTKINHNPLVHGEWVKFNGFAFKDEHYDIRTSNYTLHTGMCFSGHAFHGKDITIDPVAVKQIRLKPDSELPPYSIVGSQRFNEVIRNYGIRFPVYFRDCNEFVWEFDIPKPRYMEPTVYAGYRSLSQGGNSSATFIIVAEAEISTKPSSVFLTGSRSPKIWNDRFEMIIMPDEMKRRMEQVRQQDNTANAKYAVKQWIARMYGRFPVELIDYFADQAMKSGYVIIDAGSAIVRGITFKELMEDLVGQHVRYLDNVIATHKKEATSVQRYHANALRGVISK